MKLKKINYLILFLASLFCLGSCKNNEKTLTGFDIDLAKEVFKTLGIDVKFEEIIWEQKEIELNSKNIDLIWNGLTITSDRQEVFELSNPYMENKQVIVSKNYDNFSKENAYTISFEAGSAGNDLFNENDSFNKCSSVELSSQIDALTEVLSGTCDFAIIDSSMAGYYINSTTSFKNLKIIDFESENEFYGVAARKGEISLIDKINETLNELYNNGVMKQIAKSYGLENYLVNSKYEKSNSSDDSLKNILNKGYITIGYTIYAPIAYMK